MGVVGVASAVSLFGCTPALNWRFVPIDVSLTAQFPCRVERRERTGVAIGERRLTMVQMACETDGMTFAVNAATIVDADDIGPVLADLRSAAIANARGQLRRDDAVPLSPRLASTGARRISVHGSRADGGASRRVDVELLIFARGGSAYQVAVVGERLQAAAIDPFFDGLEVPK